VFVVGVRVDVMVVGIVVVVIILLCKKTRFLLGCLCVCVCVCVCVTYLHQNKQKFFEENYFQYFQFIFCETYACIISTPPLSSFNNNTGQNIDL